MSHFRTLALTGAFMLLMTTLAEAQYSNSVSYDIRGSAAVFAEFGRQFTEGDFRTSGVVSSLEVSLNFEKEVVAPPRGNSKARAYATATAFADTGNLQVGFGGAVTGSTAGGNEEFHATISSGRVQARWQDSAIVTGNTPGGRLITVNGFLVVSGMFALNVSGNPTPTNDPANSVTAQSTLRLSIDSGGSIMSDSNLPPPPYQGSLWGVANASLDPRVPSYMYQPQSIIPFKYFLREGVAFTIDYTMEVSGSAMVSRPFRFAPNTHSVAEVYFDADFTHTLNWGGITSVTDTQTGAPIEGWTITSASGVNYANAVPEPAGMMVLGLLLIACRRSRLRTGR
jgi:hypothetical protein